MKIEIKQMLWVFFLILGVQVHVCAQDVTLDTYPSLVSDHRAYAPGQSLTVLILEEASSATSASTNSRKSTDVTGLVEWTGGRENAGLTVSSDSGGDGVIQRKGRLVASVAVTVREVLRSGELVIYGEQKIEFNGETQFIRVHGRVRPVDIRRDNTVMSSRISDAEISYVGDGLLGSRQEPGVITRVFNWLF